jgi:NTE family protein
VSFDGGLPDQQRAVIDRLLSFIPAVGSPVQAWIDAWSQFLSPYDLNPLNINPLKELIERFVDFEAIRKCEELRLFVSATDVYTGQLRVFARQEISADAVMASAALPYVFRAVEIDGVPYWDGGYTGNPPIFPLLRGMHSPDVLVVQINPLMRRAKPTSSKEILHRVNEITFNASLSAEMRVVEHVSRLLERGELTSASGQYRPIHMHRIVLGEQKPPALGSRLNNDFDFFETLHRAGRRAARRFLDAHFDDIGVRGTIDSLSKETADAA